MKVFLMIRLVAVAWAAIMLTSIDLVSIRSQGDVEIENSGKETYSNVLWAGLSSFLTEGVIKVK